MPNINDLNAQAKAEWGKFRKWIAANPLTGFWCGVAAGVLGGGLLRGIF
jgi:hypothetical protein